MSLEKLLQRAVVWRGGTLPAAGKRIPTGFAELDALFPGGGWPAGALTEFLIPGEGVGVLNLVMPALARLSQEKRWIAWVAPPHIPYAPALAAAGVDLSHVLLIRPRAASDGLWAVEQTLRSGTCAAVLAWPVVGDDKVLRRLQLAAEAGNAWGLLFRPEHMARQSSPAALRLRVTREPRGVVVNILKRRGGWAAGPVCVAEDRVGAPEFGRQA